MDRCIHPAANIDKSCDLHFPTSLEIFRNFMGSVRITSASFFLGILLEKESQRNEADNVL